MIAIKKIINGAMYSICGDWPVYTDILKSSGLLRYAKGFDWYNSGGNTIHLFIHMNDDRIVTLHASTGEIEVSFKKWLSIEQYTDACWDNKGDTVEEGFGYEYYFPEFTKRRFVIRPSGLKKILQYYLETVGLNGVWKIKTIEDVGAFFRMLMINLNINFHPDTSMVDYVDDKGKPTFSMHQALAYDEMLNDCFDVCKSSGDDIYAIGFKIINKLLKQEIK